MMKTVFAGIAAACTATGSWAAPTDDAIIAAMKVSEQPNYSWYSTVTLNSGSYDIDGKTVVGSYTQVIVPAAVAMPPAPGARGRAARARSDGSETTVIFKGDEKHVIDTPDGWMTPEEIAAARRKARQAQLAQQQSNQSSDTGGMGMGGMGMGMGRRRGGMRGLSGPYNSSTGTTNDNEPPPFTISQPHEDLVIIVGSHTDIQVDPDGVVSGHLSETGAKLLLVPPGQKMFTPEQASGTFKLWIKDGVLTKYEIQLEGTVAFKVGSDRRELKLSETTTTELKDFGTTKFDVPPEAQRKLDS